MSAQRFCQELRLLDPATLCDFYTYASHRQCLDSLHFILSVEQYSELPPWQRLEAEQQIFSRYLDTLGPSRVNVTEQIIQTVRSLSTMEFMPYSLQRVLRKASFAAEMA